MSRIRDIIVDASGFARPGNWWFSKIPPLLAVVYLAILLQVIDIGRAVLLIVCFIVSVSCVAIYGHAINDAFDIAADQRAGKSNAMAALNANGRALLILSFLCAGFLPAMVVGYSTFAITLLALNYIWPTLYSLPGIRLKERGILGVVCDALGSHVTPTLFALAVFGVIAAVAPVDWFGFALMITLWAAALGIKGIVHHQIMDRDNDIRSGTATFVAAVPTDTIIRFLTWFNLCIELPVSVALAFVVYRWCPLAAAGLVAYCVLEAVKFGLGFRFPLGKDPRASRDSIPFANEQFYVLWLPLAAAVQLAARNPAWAWLPLLHAAMFYQPFLLQIRELGTIIQVGTRPLRRRVLGRRK
jgi:hypothetical protein